MYCVVNLTEHFLDLLKRLSLDAHLTQLVEQVLNCDFGVTIVVKTLPEQVKQFIFLFLIFFGFKVFLLGKAAAIPRDSWLTRLGQSHRD